MGAALGAGRLLAALDTRAPDVGSAAAEEDGAEAVKLFSSPAEESPFNLIIIDWAIPNMGKMHMMQLIEINKKSLQILAKNSHVLLYPQPLKYLMNPRYFIEFSQSL